MQSQRLPVSSGEYRLQESQYRFPYHFVPAIHQGIPQIFAVLPWGLQYLSYTLWVRDKVASLKPRSVLDVGCGDGRLLSMLHGVVERRVGVDPVGQAIAFAKAFVPGAEFVVGAADQIAETFDVVTCVETLEHIPDDCIPSFVETLRDRLTADGALVVSVPSTVLPSSDKHFRHYTLELLSKHLSREFELVEHAYVSRRSNITWFLSRVLANRFFIIASKTVRRLVWEAWKQYGWVATVHDGEHIVAVFRPVGRDRGGLNHRGAGTQTG